MKKITGYNIIEMYDKYGHKDSEKSDETGSYVASLTLAKEWENKSSSNTAVITRVLYNSVDNNK